jgi:ribosomal protein S18 acetylase RimI-like enzyme
VSAVATLTRIEQVDYADPIEGAALFRLLDLYARDPAGGGKPLDPAMKDDLLAGLAATPGAFSLLAFVGAEAVGMANCFTGFSTFTARPLVNVHDIVVDPRFRGRGIGRALFGKIEEMARAIRAAKVTLEVLSANEPAKALYRSLGYGDYVLDPAKGHALFWQKVLI